MHKKKLRDVFPEDQINNVLSFFLFFLCLSQSGLSFSQIKKFCFFLGFFKEKKTYEWQISQRLTVFSDFSKRNLLQEIGNYFFIMNRSLYFEQLTGGKWGLLSW